MPDSFSAPFCRPRQSQHGTRSPFSRRFRSPRFFLWQEPEIIVDASRYFTQAKHLETYGITAFLKEWGITLFAWTDLPLVPFLYGLIFKIFGESRIAIQVFTSALFSLTAVITYLIGNRLWSRETGLNAALLLLGSPYLLAQVPLMLVDVPTMFFLTWAIFSFLEVLGTGGAGKAAACTLAIACTLLSKYSAWPMLSILGVVLAVNGFQEDPRTGHAATKRGMIVLIAGAVLFAAVLLVKFEIVSRQLALLRDYQAPGLARWRESNVSTFLFQIHPLITLASLFSVGLAVQRRDPRFLIVSWLVLLAVLFNIGRIRYLLPLFPMLVLMASYGMQFIKNDPVRRFLVYGCAASSLTLVLFAYLPFAERMSAVNLERAGAYLDSLKYGEIEVITQAGLPLVANPAVHVPLLDLFTAKRIRYQYDPRHPRPVDVETSSLRFTWLYRNPGYYEGGQADRTVPVVVLTEAGAGSLPDSGAGRLAGRRLLNEFVTSEGVFQSGVSVRVYQ